MMRLRKNSTSQAVSESDEDAQEYADSDDDRGQNQVLMLSVDNRRRIVSGGSDNSSEHDQEAPQPAEDDEGESRPGQDQDHENRPNHHNTAHKDLAEAGGPSKRPKCDTSQQPSAKHLIHPNQLATAVLTTAAGLSLKATDSPLPLQTEAVANVTVFMAARAVADDRPDQFLQPQQDDDWPMVDAVHLSANTSGAPPAAAGTAETNGAPAASDDAASECLDSGTEEQQQQDSRPVPFLEPAAAAAGSSDAPNPWSENGQPADQVVPNKTAAATAKAGGSASTPAPTTARTTAVDPECAASAQQPLAQAPPPTGPHVATASGNHSMNVTDKATQKPPPAAGEGAIVTEVLADAPQEPSVWYMVLLVIAAAAVAGVVAAAVAGGDVVVEVVRLLMYMRYR